MTNSKYKKIALIIMIGIMLIFLESNNVYAESTTNTNNGFSCSYIGQIDGKNLTITKTDTKWKVNYPNGYAKEFSIDNVESNIFPSSDCEDIFYSDSSKFIRMVDPDSKYTEVKISQYCRSSSDLEQFCEYGVCQIDKPLCGNENFSKTNGNDYGECPQELKPIIFFIKKIAFNTLQIFVPILLITMGTIDFVKAVASIDDKGNKEAISKFIKRAIAAVLCFFIVTIVTIAMDMFAKTDIGSKSDWKACWFNID